MATTYRIGEIAAASGFPPSTLRYYEREGLLPAPDRTPAGHRLYGKAHLERLRFVARAKRLGLSLEETADLAAAWDGGECVVTYEQLLALLGAKLSQVHDQIVELTHFADQLQAVFERVTGAPPENGCCGLDCVCAPAFTHQPGATRDRFDDLPLTAPQMTGPGHVPPTS